MDRKRNILNSQYFNCVNAGTSSAGGGLDGFDPLIPLKNAKGRDAPDDTQEDAPNLAPDTAFQKSIETSGDLQNDLPALVRRAGEHLVRGAYVRQRQHAADLGKQFPAIEKF